MIARYFGAALVAALISATLAPAQAPGAIGGFKHDSSQPIEITSDSLEVRQAENVAIFSGAVEAGQGTLRLTADHVVVTYSQEENADTAGAIRNMQAKGNVFLTNGTENAEGAFAEYDVVTGMMFMKGDVILTQGRNAVAGQELEIDLNTGVAEMKGRVKTVVVPSSAEGSGSGQN